MDVGTTNGWNRTEVVPAREILERIGAAFPLEPIDPHYAGEVAQRYRFSDGQGELGIIASVTKPFCSDCSRGRLSAQGMFFTCLFASQGQDLRALLRGGASDAEILALLDSVWRRRVDAYSELRERPPLQLGKRPKIEMSYIGG
jgi:cyclic pyranopterin phosphate synthase